jgi:hypothetical protein
LEAGADIKKLLEASKQKDLGGDFTDICVDEAIRQVNELEETGLVEFVTCRGFVDAVKQLREWDEWERSWFFKDIDREGLRKYTCHYFADEWQVRSDHMMDDALECIVDRQTRAFLLTPEEFSRCLELSEAEGASASDLQERLLSQVARKGLKQPESRYWVKRELQEADFNEHAADFIKQSPLGFYQKLELQKLFDKHGDTSALRELASRGHVHGSIEGEYRWIVKRAENQQRRQEWFDSKTEADLAGAISLALRGKDEAVFSEFSGKLLSVFTRPELLALFEAITREGEFQSCLASFGAMMEAANA